MSAEIKSARDASWRAALALSRQHWNLAKEAESAAQLTVIRRILVGMLPGGEAEFWRLVEAEMRR